jgi:hypothetical protein
MESISDVLWRAANEFLWDGRLPIPSRLDRDRREMYSCDAVYRAAMANGSSDAWDTYRAANSFIRSLGCPTYSMYAFRHKELESDEKRQGARYLWLVFAAMIAKEQGR